MDRSCTTSAAERCGEVTTNVRSRHAGAAVFGLVVLFGAFCWLVTVAPALLSLALAVGAAVAWSVWLDREEHP